MRLIKKNIIAKRNTEKLKKNIMFIFTFYFPVGILVYCFENFYLICIDQKHSALQHIIHSFPNGGYWDIFWLFLSFFLDKLDDKNIGKENKKHLYNVFCGWFFFL